MTARASCVLAFAAGIACGHPPAPEGDVAPLIHAAVLRYEVKQFMSVAGSHVPAALLTSGPIRWIAADEVEVAGGFARTKSSTSRPTYRVVRDGGRWVCLGPIVTGMPL